MNKNELGIHPQTGLLNIAEYLPSPNCDAREGDSIDLLVIHNISLPPGKFGGNEVSKFFMNELDFSSHPYYAAISHLKVSSHLFITRIGEVKQFVPLHLRAWHAGESSFDGRDKCNDFSIGIELEGTDDNAYEAIQYWNLAAITQKLIQCYPGINVDRIVGHETIAPGRKTDPGPVFDWKYYKNLVTTPPQDGNLAQN